ncbi:type II CAAX prenyl endopeptidase Rce1 family protein [Meiothermus hypogaeus]|uniref:CAAX prenyl protease 2/Lysostaphin resistance protein A-like domain-containing protein n=2 Tax=Meiothermus hypogaeus TaxID=884155 RepID=A0A511R1B3_9DEIN|nr:CPBP family glutamic-type intramembrane protease [Meiothermus hypogaeus]RIH76717.1 hypothetical protein Mhypo_02307 [Meiothermus hypogaeus]GEM83395.1 hypothetical protein MHY01S_15610 [Meiothermus hypogaeus NBRC 106114]
MDVGLAGRIAQIAELLGWLYVLIGLVYFWIYRFLLRDEKLIFRLFKRPSLPEFFTLFGTWFLGGLALFLAKRLVEHSLPEVTVAKFMVQPFSLGVLFSASLEELRRAGFYQIFATTPLVGLWLNAICFGFAHLAYKSTEIASYPQIVFFLPLATFAFGLALTFVAVRYGLIWAILVHFIVNTARLVLVTDNLAVNYLLFFFSVSVLIAIGVAGFKKAKQEAQETQTMPY